MSNPNPLRSKKGGQSESVNACSLDGLHYNRWHADQGVADRGFHRRPERVLDSRVLNCSRFDELEKRCRLGTNQKKANLIGVVSHHILATARELQQGIGRLPSTQLNDEQLNYKIPLRQAVMAQRCEFQVKWPPG
jgi:hypothetical protein